MLKREIKYINVDELHEYKNNPRNNDNAIEAVANSIKEFNFNVPIIIDKNNVIIAGHTRLKAAQKLGLTDVPVIKADDLTEDQVKAFRLADNKTGEIATWDFEKLEEELKSIEINMEMFDFAKENLDFPEELEKEVEKEEKFIIKITFDTYKDWLEKENEFRELVENSNANMVVGSV